MISNWFLLTEVKGVPQQSIPNWRTRFDSETNLLIAEVEASRSHAINSVVLASSSKWIVEEARPCTERTEAILLAADWTEKREEVVRFNKEVLAKQKADAYQKEMISRIKGES